MDQGEDHSEGKGNNESQEPEIDYSSILPDQQNIDSIPVRITQPGGKSELLTDMLARTFDRAEESSVPVGLDGHLITCPMFDVGAGPECYSCVHNGFWDEPCTKGVPQDEWQSMSQQLNKTGRYCTEYEQDPDIQCECGLEQPQQ